MNLFYQNVLTWLQRPETMIAIIGFVCTIPQYIDKFKKAKGKNIEEKAKNFLKSEIQEAAKLNLSNDEKRELVINNLYNFLPEKEKKYLSKDNATVLLNGIYHTFIKEKIEV